MAFMHSEDALSWRIGIFDSGLQKLKIQSNQGWAPPPPNAPPLPPTAAVGNSGGKIAILALAVVFILIVASIGIYLLANPSGNNSPTGLAADFADSFGDGDFESAFSATVLSLGDDYDEYVEAKKAAFGENPPELTMGETSIIDSGDMRASEKEDAEETIDDIESDYGVKVADYCLLEYTLTVKYIDFEETITGKMLCVKIDGKWYMAEGFDIHPSLIGTWKLLEITATVDGEVTSTERVEIKMEFQEGGNGLMFSEYDHTTVEFQWERNARDKITMEMEDTEYDCTYAINGDNLLLTMQMGETYMDITVEMTLERYDGSIDVGDDSSLAGDFTLPQVNGGSVTLSSFRGKVVVLDFMATWCGPCTMELEHLKIIDDAYTDSQVVILSIDVDSSEDEALLSTYITDHDLTWSVLMDTYGVSSWTCYKATSIPTLVIIDQEGYIQFRHVGVTDSATLMAEIETLL